MADFHIRGDCIGLFRLLKASGLCDTGGEAKNCIREGLVSVDGKTELRLRCKVNPGSTVEYNGRKIRVCI